MPVSHRQVFVIDDDPGFLAAVTRLVRAGGFEAEAFPTLADFYARLPMPPNSCILADIVLCNETGLEIPDVLRTRAETTPIIFMSATDDAPTLLAANRAGALPCLRKPFEADVLFQNINLVLSREGAQPNEGTKPEC